MAAIVGRCGGIRAGLRLLAPTRRRKTGIAHHAILINKCLVVAAVLQCKRSRTQVEGDAQQMAERDG